MNKDIKNVRCEDYPGSNLETVTWELYGKTYSATRRCDDNGITTVCEYHRILPNEYYETIEGLRGETRGQNNTQPICNFGKLPEDVFEGIRAMK